MARAILSPVLSGNGQWAVGTDQVQAGGVASARRGVRGGGGRQEHEQRQPQPRRQHVGGRHAVLRRAHEAEPRVRAGVPGEPRRRRQQRARVHLQPTPSDRHSRDTRLVS